MRPFSVRGLLAAVALLLGLQGRQVLDQPLVIALTAVPLLIRSYGLFALAYAAAGAWRAPFSAPPPAR